MIQINSISKNDHNMESLLDNFKKLTVAESPINQNTPTKNQKQHFSATTPPNQKLYPDNSNMIIGKKLHTQIQQYIKKQVPIQTPKIKQLVDSTIIGAMRTLAFKDVTLKPQYQIVSGSRVDLYCHNQKSYVMIDWKYSQYEDGYQNQAWNYIRHVQSYNFKGCIRFICIKDGQKFGKILKQFNGSQLILKKLNDIKTMEDFDIFRHGYRTILSKKIFLPPNNLIIKFNGYGETFESFKIKLEQGKKQAVQIYNKFFSLSDEYKDKSNNVNEFYYLKQYVFNGQKKLQIKQI